MISMPAIVQRALQKDLKPSKCVHGYAQGDLSGARMLQEQVLAVRQRILGEEHPTTSVSAWNLFTTLGNCNDLDAAKQVLAQALLWILGADMDSLDAQQRQIRIYLQEVLGQPR
jgi:hypothetical protein